MKLSALSPVRILVALISLQGCVVVEPGHQINRLQGGYKCHSVLKIINRAIRAFSKPPNRIICIERDTETCAEFSGLRQIGRVAAVQDVEDPVCKHKRARQLRCARDKRIRWADLVVEVCVHGSNSKFYHE